MGCVAPLAELTGQPTVRDAFAAEIAELRRLVAGRASRSATRARHPLPISAATGMERSMGDKSPKSKERGLKQKNVAKVEGAAAAKSKQAGYSHVQAPVPQGKR